MFCSKSENKSIIKIHKHTLRLIYDAGDATFEYLLERDKSRTILEDNIHKSLVEIYKSLNFISPIIMRNFLVTTSVVIICSSFT